MKTLKKQNRPGGGRHLLAVHESGHAVVIELLGGKVGYISMGGVAGTAGCCVLAEPVPKELDHIATAAGNSAVCLVRSDGLKVLEQHIATSPEVAERAAADLERQRRIFTEHGAEFETEDWAGLGDESLILAGGCSDHEFLEFHVRAARLLRPVWPRVLKLADELLWTGRVEGDRVREIVHSRALRLY